MKTLDRELAAPTEQEVEALIKEARQRQRRRRRTIALVLLAATGTTLGVLAITTGRGIRGSERSVAGKRISASVLGGSGTTLLMWPAGAPNFGDLPGGGSGTTADLANLSTGHVSLRRIPGIAGGSFSYALMPVSRWLVYNSDSGVSVIADDLDGSPRVLGSASWFVPSAIKGSVLLVHVESPGVPRTVRSVSVATGALGRTIVLPNGTRAVVEATDRGLLLEFPYHLDLWQPGHKPTQLAYLTHATAFAVSARLLVYGSSCTSEEATSGFSNGPVGYSACATLRVLDVVTGKRSSFPAPQGTLGWVPSESQSALETAIAPDGTMIAAQAAISPARIGRTRLFVIHLERERTSPTAVPRSTAREGADAAWSIDGSWLLYQGPGTRLRAFEPTTGQTQTLGERCCEAAAMVAIPNQSR
jgi:hypothetical protein